jgi:hypothetical protein
MFPSSANGDSFWEAIPKWAKNRFAKLYWTAAFTFRENLPASQFQHLLTSLKKLRNRF